MYCKTNYRQNKVNKYIIGGSSREIKVDIKLHETDGSGNETHLKYSKS